MVDVDEERINILKDGRVPLYEPGLEEQMVKVSGRLGFTAELGPVAREADVVFIAVSTPSGEGGAVDLSNVEDVARTIGAEISGVKRERPLVLVNKSTVPVGSGDYVSMLVREGIEEAGNGDASFQVVSNPEFLREGSAVHDSLFPDRIVLGCRSSRRTWRVRR